MQLLSLISYNAAHLTHKERYVTKMRNKEQSDETHMLNVAVAVESAAIDRRHTVAMRDALQTFSQRQYSNAEMDGAQSACSAGFVNYTVHDRLDILSHDTRSVIFPDDPPRACAGPAHFREIERHSSAQWPRSGCACDLPSK